LIYYLFYFFGPKVEKEGNHQKFDKVENKGNDIILKNIRQWCCILIRMRRQAKIKEDIIEETHQKRNLISLKRKETILFWKISGNVVAFW